MPPIARLTSYVEKGRASALIDGADIRYVEVDGVELVRRIYVTVRDASWDNPPVTSLSTELTENEEVIVLRASGRQQSQAACVTWNVQASLHSDGRLLYSVVISPEGEFLFSRIGLCVLHPPASYAGRPYRASTASAHAEGSLPELIAPQIVDGMQIFALFAEFSRLEVDLRGLGTCRFDFAGDLFEMEDQRNWSDGSFKSYCTPLSVPRPQLACPGDLLEQSVHVSPPAAHSQSRRRSPSTSIEIEVGEPSGCRFPDIGLALGEPLTDQTAGLIRELSPEHLRVELRHPSRFAPMLTQASADSALTQCPVVLGLHLGDRPEDELDALTAMLQRVELHVLRVLVFSRVEPVSRGCLVRLARQRLGSSLPDVPWIGGTDAWFVDLNRARPQVAEMDGVAWSVTPQVHGDDELTLIEALEPQTDQGLTARSFAPGLDLFPGPITLRPRYNPNADDAHKQALDHPASSVDPRQSSQFAAAWTAGSIGAQALAGVRAVTYYETVGRRGVVASDHLSRFPAFDVLARACRWASRDVIVTSSSAPLTAKALVVRGPADVMEGLLVNLTPSVQRVRLRASGFDHLRLGKMQCDAAVASASTTHSGCVELGPWEVVPIGFVAPA